MKNKAAGSKLCSPKKEEGIFFHSYLYSVLELTPTPVYGHTTTAMPDTSTPPLPGPKKSPLRFFRAPLTCMIPYAESLTPQSLFDKSEWK